MYKCMKNKLDATEVPKPEKIMKKEPTIQELADEEYFMVYENCSSHQLTMQDKRLMDTFRKAILGNPHLFKGKVVLEIGSSLGILSMMAAKAGASKVIAVENSSMANHAITVINNNKLSHIITIIKGKVEEISLPEGIEKVDIILSNWMGYTLFFNNLLETVLYARDKWLKKDGMIFPDKFRLFINAIEARSSKYACVNFWKDVWGFNMDCISEVALREPRVDVVEPEQVVTNFQPVNIIDLYSMQKSDLAFSNPFELTVLQNDVVHGFSTFFEVQFNKCQNIIGFSTSPNHPPTHWKQTIFFLEEPLYAEINDKITGWFALRPNTVNKRELDIVMKVDYDGIICSFHGINFYNMH